MSHTHNQPGMYRGLMLRASIELTWVTGWLSCSMAAEDGRVDTYEHMQGQRSRSYLPCIAGSMPVRSQVQNFNRAAIFILLQQPSGLDKSIQYPNIADILLFVTRWLGRHLLPRPVVCSNGRGDTSNISFWCLLASSL
jgi:hypothetical protein